MKDNVNKISWWRTSFGEDVVDNIVRSVRNECISMGSVTAQFEGQLAQALDVPYVVTTTSGSMALLMAMMAVGIKPGDEVIVPNRTWIATAHAPMLLGAKVILVDVLADRSVMDVSQIEEKITSKTKAIIPVALNGRAVDMDEVWKIAKKHGLHVVEDAAQALFCRYAGNLSSRHMGTESEMGCFSFSMAKLLPTGQGGFVATKHKDVYDKLKRIRTHGVDDVINCTFFDMGFNFRFTDVQSSIGQIQLERIKQRIAQIQAIYAKYELALKGIGFLKLIPVNVAAGEIPIYAEVLCKEREKLIAFLAAQGIQTRPFYPDLNTAKHLGATGRFPNAEVFGSQGLVLPCGPDQPLENIDRVIECLKLFGKKD
ncbi:MAG: DegT/DnrJ/EryC1/StrS family aminotransferase [Candidatus Omnitrophica bacterium]|nr:DegT/DnrJ/EryC1/StrS family aminotransferase [Candidatus Omnitrophota bacterium]